ncbi:MAG: hypothetical protein JWQ66_3954 [Mucilaginibacter sp.]|nr:hypothetical protein [Mucilaginibacter sp.]
MCAHTQIKIHILVHHKFKKSNKSININPHILICEYEKITLLTLSVVF